jgi:outer membrane protein TolC
MPIGRLIRKNKYFALTVSVSILLTIAFGDIRAQQYTYNDSLLPDATLANVIRYSLARQPAVQQSLIDEKIVDLQIKSKLADWYPQIDFGYTYLHNFQLQTTVFNGNPQKIGINNTSALQFSASQTIFNRDVLLAKRSKDDILQQARQQTANSKINVIVDVTKAFYAVLATQQQVSVVNETIIRLEKSLKDARAQYDAGIVDKTDYKRAIIALNNAIATKKANQEGLKSRTDYLKAVMNYPVSADLTIIYDSSALEKAMVLDTLQMIDYSKRIEYQILQTRRKLLETNLQYNKWSYLPSLYADGAYNLNYMNDEFSKLYQQSFPNSYAGLTLSLPIFQGGKRKHQTKQAKWELVRTDMEMTDLKNAVNSEYSTALSAYKTNLANFYTVKENAVLAQEVYDVIDLQYRSGIKAYLEVIAAETDLRTAQINYYNALYLLLSSKIDVQKALGDIDADGNNQ